MEPYQATRFRELDIAGVAYVLCGGLATVRHGVHRFTADIDLAVALNATNLRQDRPLVRPFAAPQLGAERRVTVARTRRAP